MKIRVYHGYYGCDTGCCGHIIEFTDVKGKEHSHFEFSHPDDEEVKSWAIELAQDYIRNYHPECYDTIDWNTIETKGSTDNC